MRRPPLTTTTFQEIGYTSSKSGKCPVCGKMARRNKYFYQTLNPFNKNAQGVPKTGGEIIAELRPKSEAWKKEPCYHAKCEGWKP